MNVHNDLSKVKISHGCENCCCSKCRYSNRGMACENFSPEDTADFMDYILDSLLKTVEPSKERKLRRRTMPDKSYDDKIPSLDYYYVLLVNSVLSEIRKGGVDYAYNLEQIRDIMRFEPDITVTYIADAGAYEVKLRGASRKEG